MVHKVIEKWANKQTAFGLWITLPGSQLARTVAKASDNTDFIVIDCEHGLIPLQGGAQESTAAIRTSYPSHKDSPSVFVRIPAVDPSSQSWQIKLALDGGAQGVVCPMVSNAATAREVAKWARFPPIGTRGFGSAYAFESWGEGVTRLSYVDLANKNIVVAVQIETAEGAENVEEIAKVDGVDVLFIGPYDLAMSVGEPRPQPAPSAKLESIIQRVKAAAHNNGKKCAYVALSGAEAKKRAMEGFDLVTVTSESSQIIAGIATQLAAAVAE